jgi:type VI secretion system protein ImpL
VDYTRRNRLAIAAVLLINVALNLLLWFKGNLFFLHATLSKIGALSIVTVGALSICCYLYRRAKKQRHALYNSQSEHDNYYTDSDAIKQLQGQFEHAVGMLKNSDIVTLMRGSKALYTQPWYLLIGAEGAGKTALTRQSGLDFIHTEGSDLSLPLQPTPNCNFKFSEHAILLDTAGRYITDGRAHNEWIALLKLLRRYRSKLPLNGLILTLDMGDFLLAEEEQHSFQLTLLRERINEMIDYLGIIFPVYVIFTKCDQINGFDEYFADLSEQEKAQVFGTCLFSVKDQKWQPETGSLRERFAALLKQLQQQSISKLAHTHASHDKINIVEFPNQFKFAMNKFTDFVELLFKPGFYKEQPRLAGVYFTSAEQRGQKVVHLSHTRQQVFTLIGKETSRNHAVNGVFAKHLFSDIILPLQGMVKANKYAKRFQLSFKAIMASLFFITVISGVSFMLTAYISLQDDFTKNRTVIDALVKSVSTADQQHSTLTQSLTMLRKRFLSLDEDANKFEAFLPYLALDEKRLMVRDEMETLYFYLLNLRVEKELQPLLKRRMEELAVRWKVSEQQSSNRRATLRNEYYNLLKVSLMLTSDIDKLDIEFVTNQLANLWQQKSGQAANADDYTALTELIVTYLQAFKSNHHEIAHLHPWYEMVEPIATARADLNKPLNSHELYQKLISDAYANPDLTLANLLSSRFQPYMVNDITVPWLYSKTGWDNYARAKLVELQLQQRFTDWVVGLDSDTVSQQAKTKQLKQIMSTVKARYFTDYAKVWFQFIENVRYRRLNNIQETQETLNAIAAPNGLFVQLIANMSQHIYLYDIDPVTAKPEQRIPELAERFPVFNQLSYFQQSKRDNASFNQYQKNIVHLNKDLFSILSSYSIEDAALVYTGQVLSAADKPALYKAWYDTADLISQLNQDSSVQLEYLLTEPITRMWLYLMAESKVALDQKWQQTVYPSFVRHIDGHYPFSAVGNDASLQQVIAFLNPQDGLFWSFVEQDLAPFIADFERQKKTKSWLGLSLAINLDIVEALRKAAHITDSFFRHKRGVPRISYQIMPTPKKTIAESYLNINGYEYRYRNEPEEWRTFVWPSRRSTSQAKIYATSGKTGHIAQLHLASDWALFHLIDQAEVKSINRSTYRLTWALMTRRGEHLEAEYKIKMAKQNDLFDRTNLYEFDLPNSLFNLPTAEVISSELDLQALDN